MIKFIQTPQPNSLNEHTETVITLTHNGPTFDDLLDMFINFLSAIGFSQAYARSELTKDNWCDGCEYRPKEESEDTDPLEWPEPDDPIYVDNHE